jgi:RimJ/RimL family protein N-acetyltransferase
MLYSEDEFIIRMWQKGDEPFLAHQANNINIWRCLDDSFPSPYTYDDAVVFVDDNLKLDKQINFAIVVDDDPIGNVNITYIKGNKTEINIWISEEYWGQGIATKIISWTIKRCFLDINVNTITALVFSNNEAAKKIFINNGFTLDKVKKNAICKEGYLFDKLIFIKKRRL